MESFATPYPVIFHDGEQEHDKGHVGVHSVLTFKRFQSLLSQKIGVPANQLSAVFVCRRTLKGTEKRQKLPINENTNFNIILNQHNPNREKDCHFLVSLKKSKKDRKGTTKWRSVESDNGDDDGSSSSRSDASPPDERPPKIDAAAYMSSSEEASPPVSKDLQSFSNDLQSFSDSPVVPNQNDAKPTGSEKTLLTREMGGWVSPRLGTQNACQNDRQESACSSTFQISGATLSRSRRPDACWFSDKQQIQDERLYGRLREKVVSPILDGQPSQLFSVASRAEGYQDRPVDGMRSAMLLQRNGFLTPTIGTNPLASLSAFHTSRPLMYPNLPGTAGMVLSRIPTANSGLSSALSLQQAQAQYLSLQNQHPSQMHISSEAFTKLRGVVREFASIDNGKQAVSGVCGYCCSCKEKNINPTPFHICVQDRVTMGFRGPSPAGPIERPAKRLEAAA